MGSPTTAGNGAGSHRTPEELTKIREKPFIVICGCTGTGKTKLSIQLAEWLIKNNRQAEIINADAMQLYKNLDVITNKATEEEMKGIKHHLIGYLDYTCRTNSVGDYVERAVDLIDTMLAEDKIPVLVGGTNYYIHSVLYDALINEAVEENESENLNQMPQLTDKEDSELIRLILESGGEKNESNKTTGEEDINLRSHDSCHISNQTIYEHLMKVDVESAQKLHPNDRRKMMRALQIYYTFGQTKTHIQSVKNNRQGSGLFHGPIRYKNACIFALNAEDTVLNKRLDDRVDQMIQNGLLGELDSFKKEFDARKTGQTLKEYSRDYQFGIFQSIGFKEFDEYFQYLEANSSNQDSAVKNDLLKKGIEDMKVSTRRYARIQMRWIRNRFIKRANEFAPIVHEVDTSDVSRWDEDIFEPARANFEDYLNGVNGSKAVLNSADFEKELKFEYNKCEYCDKVFVDKFQWTAHLKGRKHKKRVENLKRMKDNLKRKQQEDGSEIMKKTKQDQESFVDYEKTNSFATT